MSDFWIPPYHRDQLPEGTDNSAFGEVATQDSPLTAESGLSIPSTAYAVTRSFPASSVFPQDATSGRNAYAACEATIERAICKPLPTTLFFPDNAVIVDAEAGQKLLTESIWHSVVHFSKFVRCDRTTNWQYRIDRNFEPIVIRGTVANAYHRYYFQYFHWFFDSMPRIWALKNHLKNEKFQWFAGPLDQKFHRLSLELLDLDLDQFLRFDGNAVVHFERAYNPAFRFSENINTLRPDFNSGTYYAGWSDDYVLDMRSRAAAKVRDLPAMPTGERIYITRPDTTHRKVENESEVLSLLQQYGFECFAPGTKTLFEQIMAFQKAKFIVGPHGAGFTNLLWSNPGTVALEFMPRSLSDVGYRFLSNFAGHSHNVLLCNELADPRGSAYANMEVDLDALTVALRDLDA